MTDLKTALWCDLTTDAERSAWLLLGRGYKTGVVAKLMQSDLARAYQRLSQLEQEPVAWVDPATLKRCSGKTGNICCLEMPVNFPVTLPQREWQGLTDEEAAQCWNTSAVQSWKAIEAKIKEKNT